MVDFDGSLWDSGRCFLHADPSHLKEPLPGGDPTGNPSGPGDSQSLAPELGGAPMITWEHPGHRCLHPRSSDQPTPPATRGSTGPRRDDSQPHDTPLLTTRRGPADSRTAATAIRENPSPAGPTALHGPRTIAQPAPARVATSGATARQPRRVDRQQHLIRYRQDASRCGAIGSALDL
ncbi:hypothetical protein FRACA_810018 [Frankia canadensis]|uniref:Uncharacterized protein n=1 Tax=Frankia canadensis TaxID=1836972 RepID=A0A2I2L1T8_9ACTN|nr:hypothetical protein FRACA_810018 [Frankia canadensis]SOU59117.1 hypothetical protein FRACA_810018 [Frankia canadensis]